MGLNGKYGYDVKFVVFEHELVDIGCFEHRIVRIFDPVVKETLEDAQKYAKELECKQEKQVIIPKNNITGVKPPESFVIPKSIQEQLLEELKRLNENLESRKQRL